MKTFIYVIVFSLNFLFAQSALLINEFVASNINTYGDEYRNYNDWIELYNSSDSTIDIGGMYISDDRTDISKWQIPAGSDLTTIEPDSFLILWADGDPLAGVLHLDFKLSADGEQIILSAEDGISIIDSVTFPEQTANYSYGRSSTDPLLFKYFIEPTPLAPNGKGYEGVVSAPVIETPSGNYPGSIDINVSNSDPEAQLYYTFDGQTPRLTSAAYNGPVPVTGSTVFSVRAYKEGFIPSHTISKAYFIDETFNLPVLSIITDPPNLFSDSIGIYINYTKGSALWERPISGHYIKDDSAHSFTGGIRIQGRTSRTLPKKSFRLFFKTGYGQERLEYDMFGLDDVQSFKNLVTRPGYDDDISPSNPLGTLLRDPVVSEGWKKVGGLTSAGTWAIMYINNDYWGIYNIRESINDFFISDHRGYENFDLIRYDKKGPLLQAGTFDDWNLMWNLVENEDLSLDENYQTFKNYMDIDNLLSYQAMIQCTQYRSWTWGAYVYKEKSPEGRWRWAPWDMDRAYTDQSWPGIANYQLTGAELWGNLMIKKLLLNDEFKALFINRLADFLNYYYAPDKINALIDSLAGIITAEIPGEAERWDSSVNKWDSNVERLHEFANNRPDIVFQQMQDNFELSAPRQLTLDFSEDACIIKVNSLTINTPGWSGKYFPENKIDITVVAKPGYKFAGWTNESLPDESSISINLTEDLILKPVFEQLPMSDYFEIIAPSVIKTTEKLPIIVRTRKPSGEMNSHIYGEFAVSNTSGLADSTFKIKKGTGVLVAPANTTNDFKLQLQTQDYETEQKSINVNNELPQEHHSGVISDGNIIWTNSADHIIDDDLTIESGSILQIEEGARILLMEHVNIIINGVLHINGSKENPVLFTSYDTSYSWGGIEFYNSLSNITYCFFVNGGGDPTKGWAHTSTQPILFARSASEVSIENVYILNSPGKAVGATHSIFDINKSVIANIFHGGEFSYSKIHVNNSYIMNIPNDDGQKITTDDDNDGFHMDNNYSGAGKSIIENSFFIDGKDDGIDQSSKNLIIRNCWIEGWLHEGVAASGGDTVYITNTIASKCNNGFESGWGSPQVVIDHCLTFENNVGYRFGDSYNTPNTGHMTVTNSIAYNNNILNIRNYTKHLAGPYPGGIDITYSMTNDTVYDDFLGNITGVPQFDNNYHVLPTSPGASAGINGTNMGLVDDIPARASQLVINEIMYKAADLHDTGDWIELYNPATYAKNISGWILKDDADITPFILPPGTIIDGQGYLVLCEDSSAFKVEHPEITNYIGNFEFGFNRNSDQVRFYTANGYLIDSVSYSSSAPWPTAPDGNGPSLELSDPLADNNIYDSWMSSQNMGGTPGARNNIITDIKRDDLPVPDNFKLYQNYPNPFNPQTTITYDLPETLNVTLTIFDISGRQIFKTVRKHLNAGSHYFNFDASRYASGIYIYQIRAGSHVAQRKMLLIK